HTRRRRPFPRRHGHRRRAHLPLAEHASRAAGQHPGGRPDHSVAGQRRREPARRARERRPAGSPPPGGLPPHPHPRHPPTRPARGDFPVTYTDGSTQQVRLGLTDWTRYGGKSPVAFGNTTVATLPYRLGAGNGAIDQTTTYVFAATANVDAGKTVRSVTLPNT